MSELTDKIAEEALKPKAVSGAGASLTRRSLQELDDHASREAAKEAIANPVGMAKRLFSRIVPPGGRG